MEPIRQQIAENIRKYRKAKGLSVAEVGKAVNKSGKTISAWERGQGQPDADELIAICVLLGVGIADMYSAKSEKTAVLSEDEARLLSFYRGMTEQGRSALMASAEGLYDAFRVKNNQVSKTA